MISRDRGDSLGGSGAKHAGVTPLSSSAQADSWEFVPEVRTESAGQGEPRSRREIGSRSGDLVRLRNAEIGSPSPGGGESDVFNGLASLLPARPTEVAAR